MTAFSLYRRMCDMLFSYGHGAYTNHTGTRTLVFPRRGEGGVSMLFNKNVLFSEKDKKAVTVIETFFS